MAQRWSQAIQANVAGRRLRAAMDYWCAMWFWPLRQAELLPERTEWLEDLRAILDGTVRDAGSETPRAKRIGLAREIAASQKFVHWAVDFAEVHGEGGFDVVVGNPPWIQLNWSEGGILSDLDPRLVIRRLTAGALSEERVRTFETEGALDEYLSEFEDIEGQKSFYSSVSNYSLLAGVRTNLYKCFLVHAWELLHKRGAGGMFHQAGIFDDPKGGHLRSKAFPRMRLVALAKNQLSLFEGVTHQRPYCFTVWSGDDTRNVSFRCIANLFHPRTLLDSDSHDGVGAVPAIKNADGDWDLRGHKSRIVPVNESTLALFARLYDPPGTPAREARLPVVHSAEILSVLRKFAEAARSLADMDGGFFATQHFNETNQQKDATIRRETTQAADPSQWIASGPHFYVGTPFNKTPNPGCRHNQDYSAVDWMDMPEDYLPLTNYVPGVNAAEYRSRTPHWQGRPVTDWFRHVHREMVAPTGERTLAPAIIPPGVGHTNTVLGIAFESNSALVRYGSMAASVCVDFFVKSTGMGHVNTTLAGQLPLAGPGTTVPQAARYLRLNCLTTHYADLWSELYQPDFAGDTHTKPDPRLPNWQHLAPDWTWDTPLRSPFARRQALVELDALAAIALGLSAEELCLIYRVQFPVLQGYEADTWYDRRGRIVFTNNRGLNGVGLTRKQWQEIEHAQTPEDLPPWAHDALGPYQPPFDRCDRETDMTQAYNEFIRRGVTP